MARRNLTIIIPAFNESPTIYKTVRDAKKFGKVIVVDDASTDDTLAKAKKAGAIVIRNKKNLGYDYSLEKGLLYARKNNFYFAITFDADGQHLAKDLPKVINSLLNGNDLVLGIRNKIPRLAEKISIMIFNFFYNIKDPYCGLKAYRLTKLKKNKLVNYKSTGTEIALYLLKEGYSYNQIKITTKDRKDDPRFGNRLISNIKILKSTFISFSRLLAGKI